MLKLFTLTLLLGAAVAFAPRDIMDPIDPLIVNGTRTTIQQYPWIVSIRTVTGSHTCGGSLISPTWVLSAAHCSQGRSIQYGLTTITSARTNVIDIQRWILHESYNLYTIQNDIAVVQLASAIPSSVAVRPVKMPKSFYEVPGNWQTNANLAGWGYTAPDGPISTNLLMAPLLVAGNTECNANHSRPVISSMLCAGVPEGWMGQCSGDSGGPLTLLDGTLVGLVSWSMKPCQVPPYPGVYTKVSHFVGWIQDKTGLVFP